MKYADWKSVYVDKTETKLLSQYTAQEEKVSRLYAENHLFATQGNRESNVVLQNEARNAEKTLTKLQIECGKNNIVLNTGLSRTLNAETIAEITEKVRQAPENSRILWNLASRQMKVLDSVYSGIPHYDIGQKGIKFNLQADTVINPRKFQIPPYTNLFHELGHLIDHFVSRYTGFISCFDKNYSVTLKDEAVNYIKAKIANLSKVSNKIAVTDVYTEISKELRAMSHIKVIDISDMFSGATDDKVRGYWHHPADYWKNAAILPREAFASMFSATINNPESLAQIKRYFPKSYDIFEMMIDDCIKRSSQ